MNPIHKEIIKQYTYVLVDRAGKKDHLHAVPATSLLLLR